MSSEDQRNKRDPERSAGLDFDLDDAFDNWEREFEDLEAETTPMPQKPGQSSDQPNRSTRSGPLYRPPKPEELQSNPAAGRSPEPFAEDDEEESTRAIPAHLVESLRSSPPPETDEGEDAHKHPTAPPPASAESVELDLDVFLSEDQEPSSDPAPHQEPSQQQPEGAWDDPASGSAPSASVEAQSGTEDSWRSTEQQSGRGTIEEEIFNPFDEPEQESVGQADPVELGDDAFDPFTDLLGEDGGSEQPSASTQRTSDESQEHESSTWTEPTEDDEPELEVGEPEAIDPSPGELEELEPEQGEDVNEALEFESESQPLAQPPPPPPPSPQARAERRPPATSTPHETQPGEQAPARAPEGAPSPPGGTDQGAAAARRTVRYRKPRSEHFRLVGRSSEALAARNELLAELAKKTSGRAAARLHMARAELSEQQGDVGSAESCRADARQAHPRDLVALRAARRDASVRGDWEQVASLLQTESELGLSGQDKAMALTALAEVQLRKLEDAAGAEKSARSAMTAHKGSIVAPLLVAEAAFAGQRDNEAMQALKLAADRWSDPKGRAALIGHVARSAEHAGQLPRARRLYAEATQADPTALDARLGLARTLRATGELDEAIETIQQAASQLQGGGSEGLRRMAARWLHLRAGRPQDAVALLDDARGLFALQTRADAAAAAGDRQAEAAAAEAWAAASGGTERALALVTLAERRAEDGDLDGADQALKDAALADSKLGTVRVVREVLARRAGDPSRLAHAVQSDAEDEGGALTAAAKLARDDRSSNEERELLARAMEEGASPETADVVGLDTAAAAAEVEATHAALRREVERAPPEHKAGPLLALGGLFSEHGQTDAAEAVLREARDAAPGDPLVLRPLARLIAPARPKEAAALWLEEASSGPAERAAFAATQAGRLLARAEADASSAFRRALDVQPSYAPAAWAMEPLARRAQDTWTLAQLQERMTEFGGPPEQVAARWVRAGLLRADEAPQQAIDNLERARELQPDDAILYELLLRLMRTDAPANRARLLETSAERIGESIELSARLRAAAAHEQAEDYASAATAYRQVLKANPEDAVARHALDWAELAAGEHARVAERRFDRVRAAQDDASRVAALESLANLDLFEREDPASAVLSLQSILEHAPDHLPTLRALERYYMEQGRTADLLWVQRQLLEHLTEGDELAGHLRLATRLRLAPEDAPGSAADEMLLAHAERVRMDLWLARRIEGAARVTQDPPRQLAPLDYVAGALVGPMEKASAHLRASEVAAGALGYDAALERLRPAVQEASDHPVVTEQLAHLAQQGDQPDEAARAFETAATHARSARRQVDLWYHAGLVWQRSGESDRALAAFEHAASIDVTHADLFEQMRQMLTGRGDTARLAELTRTRLQAGGDPVTLAELHVTEASLAEELGDREGAKEALRAALALTPERADALRRLAELSLEDEEWRPAAESLIRFARLRQGRQELHWVFSTLGDIYDHHMPDPKRAEAAYRRVLKLAPDDTDTMDRLAELYRREGQVKQATELLRDLAGREPDADKAQNYRIRLARVLEEQGDTRGAERELEQARNDAPTHLTLLRGIVDFYRRQQADSALAVHLNRAVNDFRNRITQTPTDKQAWAGLVEVLDWRGRPDAARCAASSTAALGLVDVELAKRLDAEGGAPGAGSAATDSALDELLAPEQLSLPLRQVFRLASDAIAKHVAFDPKSLRAQRVAKDSPYAAEAKRVGEWFGVGDVQVLTTTAAPRLCIPLSSSPMTVAIGRDLLQSTSERERLFLFARAVKIAATHLTVTVHAQPDELALAVGGLVRIQDSNYAPSGFETAELESVGRKVFKAVPRRLRDELAPSVLEMGGEAHFDPTRLGLAASELADRVALAAIGSTPAGLGALLKLAGEDFTDSLTPKERVAAVRRVSEAWSLLSFSISDAYFEARHRAKADSL